MAAAWIERAVGERVPCPIHPRVETHLRCVRCGRPICPKCLVHTPRGAQCPRCVPSARSSRRGPFRWLLGATAGCAVAALGGLLLLAVPFGALLILPLMLLGLLVGEVTGAGAGRRGGLSVAMVALLSTIVGPTLAQALFVEAFRLPLGLQASSLVTLLGPFGPFVLLGAGVLAALTAARQDS